MNIYPPLNANPQNNPMYSQQIQNQPIIQGYSAPHNRNFQQKPFPKAYTIVQIVFFIVLCLAMIALLEVIKYGGYRIIIFFKLSIQSFFLKISKILPAHIIQMEIGGIIKIIVAVVQLHLLIISR